MEDTKDLQMARRLAALVSQSGGSCYYVGGFVRDKLMGRDSKDVDIEVHGISPETLCQLLDTLGQRMHIGTSFGVYALKGCHLDIALPRTERVTGRGHRDFEITVDPYIGISKAAKRRDFTINAMMQDVLTGKLLDPYGGQNDLKDGILRHIDDQGFAEDALRVLRGAQFAARFGLTLAPETAALCAALPLDTLPKQRVMEETKKALLQAEKPSVYFEILRQMGQLKVWFPELAALIDVEQEPRFHGEGDVWNHTMLVLDIAAARRSEAQNPLGLLFAALCHDMGKALCSQRIDGVIHAYRHETIGLAAVQAFMARLTDEKALKTYVQNMTELHMKPNMMIKANSAIKATNKLFDASVCPQDLILLAVCDDSGSLSARPKPSCEVQLGCRLAQYHKTMAMPGVTGKDLIKAGLAPGNDFSQALAYAHKLHLAGIEKSSALKQTLRFVGQLRKAQSAQPAQGDPKIGVSDSKNL